MGDRREGQAGIPRRTFVRAAGGAGLGFVFYACLPGGARIALAQVPGGTLDPASDPEVPDAAADPAGDAQAGTSGSAGAAGVDYYEISMRQFAQQVLPAGLPATTVWGYGAVNRSTSRACCLHHAPSLTIEAQVQPAGAGQVDQRARRRRRAYLPHLLPVDPTLHWANPPGGAGGRDTRPTFTQTPGPYTGPGADRAPTCTAPSGWRRERRLPGGVVPARGRRTSRRATPRRAPGTHFFAARPTAATARLGARATPSSSTRTTSGRRRSGSTTTRSA